MAANTEKVPAPPPNLRKSNPDDKGGECEICTHYNRGACVIHPPATVDREWVCDDFSRDSSKSDSDDVSRQPRTLKDAEAETRRRYKPSQQ